MGRKKNRSFHFPFYLRILIFFLKKSPWEKRGNFRVNCNFGNQSGQTGLKVKFQGFYKSTEKEGGDFFFLEMPQIFIHLFTCFFFIFYFYPSEIKKKKYQCRWWMSGVVGYFCQSVAIGAPSSLFLRWKNKKETLKKKKNFCLNFELKHVSHSHLIMISRVILLFRVVKNHKIKNGHNKMSCRHFGCVFFFCFLFFLWF
jgi:hypothetical protein